MSDAFESERLRILEKVSNGEISPQEGSLQIAMLKVKFQEEAAPEPDHQTTGMQEAAGAWRQDEGQGPYQGGFAWGGTPANFKPTLPVIAALAIPVLFVLGLMLGGMAMVLAIPTLLLVLVWNAIAATAPDALPTLAFFPTLGAVLLAFIVLSILRGWWRTRLIMNMFGRGR